LGNLCFTALACSKLVAFQVVSKTRNPNKDCLQKKRVRRGGLNRCQKGWRERSTEARTSSGEGMPALQSSKFPK
jgi:hypothetical protein